MLLLLRGRLTMPVTAACVRASRSARPDLAMTGEVTLTGKVLPVGGIREKIMAARRAQVTCVVLPAANRKDWDEVRRRAGHLLLLLPRPAPHPVAALQLPDHLREGIDAHFAAEYADVFAVAFPSDGAPPAAP